MERRWKILCLLFFTRIALGFQFQVLGSISPRLVDALEIDYRLAGILVGLFLFAGIFLSLPAGLAYRYATDKSLVTTGLVLLGVGGLVSGIASTYGVIAIGRIISGAGFVFGTLYFTKMVADWFSGKELATAMGILVLSWPIGIAIGQILHPLVAAQFGYASAFYVASIYSVGSAMALWWFYKAPASASATASVVNNNAPVAKLSAHYLKLTLIAALVWAFFNAGYVVYLSFIVEALINSGYTEGTAAAIASVPSWMMVITAIVAGQIADRTGNRNRVLYISMAGAVVSLLLMAQGVVIVAAVFLFGLLAMGSAGIIMALTGESMPAESRAFGMGLFFTLYFMVGLPAPGIAGWLYDITGNPGAPLLFGAGLFALVAVCNYWFRVSVSTKGGV